MLDPPERNSSTLMPVCCSNMLETFCAVSIGTEQYQTTLPSFLAAAMSTGCAMAEPAANSRAAPAISPRRLSVPMADLRFFRWLAPLGQFSRPHPHGATWHRRTPIALQCGVGALAPRRIWLQERRITRPLSVVKVGINRGCGNEISAVGTGLARI